MFAKPHISRFAFEMLRWHALRTGARGQVSRAFKAGVACLTAASMLVTSLAATPVYAAETLPVAAPAPAITMQECQDLNDAQIRRRIRDLTQAALNRELGQLHYKELVDVQWQAVHMNERLDIEIDDAVRVVRADTGVLQRAYSNISRETAEKIAIAVAERTFASEGFKTGLSDIATGVGVEFGKRIEGSAEKVAEPLITCVRSALQTRYGSAVAEIFAKETEDNIDVAPLAGSAKINKSDLAVRGVGTISGIVLIVSRRVIARMVTNVGRRVAGLVASRLVSSLIGLLGLALLVNDLVEASEGVFPLVAERMKSDDAKGLIRDEIAKSLETELKGQTDQIAEETADRIYSFWLDFRQKYNALLSLSEKNEAFAVFLKDRKIDQLGRLGLLVGLLQGQEGESGVFRRVGDGSLARALFDLDDAGVSVAVGTKSLDRALAWNRLAGSKLPKAIAFGLTQHTNPDELTEPQLSALLDFDDRNKALRVAQLDRTARDAILALPAHSVKTLSRRLTADELGALGVYQSRLEPAVAASLLRAVNDDPSVMRSLASSSVQNSVLNSRDQLAAVTMLLRENAALSIGNIGNDLTAVREGRVHYRIFVERYWTALLVVLFLILLALVWFRRLFQGQRQTVLIRTSNDGKR